ncbi:MAG: 2-hydroxyacid dehydrogenase [bacterium]
MNNHSVLVARRIPEEGLEILKAYCRKLEVYDGDRPIPRRTLLSLIRGKQGLLCCLTDKVDEKVMDASGRLKVISNYAVGYDNIDVNAASRRGIVVTNTPGVLTDATAELAWSLLFSTARRIVECDRFTRTGKFKGWDPMGFLGRDVHGKTLGIIGAGRIGTAFGLKSRGFNMKILYYDSLRNQVLEENLNARKVKLSTLLRESDFVSVHVALTEQTHHFFSVEQFEMMKPSAIFINTSRGKVVDEKALVRALKSKSIAGAGVDVYEQEPEIEPELLRLESAVLSPHIGSATVETRKRMAVMACSSLTAALSGEKPANIVNPSGAKRRKDEGAVRRKR